MKHSEDLNSLKKIVTNNFVILKSAFLFLASRSSLYPTIGNEDFIDYSKKTGIIENHVSISMIDQLFVAVNFELED